mmetsp:Transcript_1107/g.2836  ORF Transcript_1107/g.2836 Transcript_1107/m.2836 type:complete len:125 (+) Transcript_1107:248-622(+)
MLRQLIASRTTEFHKFLELCSLLQIYQIRLMYYYCLPTSIHVQAQLRQLLSSHIVKPGKHNAVMERNPYNWLGSIRMFHMFGSFCPVLLAALRLQKPTSARYASKVLLHFLFGEASCLSCMQSL